MVEKVERYVARDGREFIHQESALRHEAIEAMIAEIPELALVRGKLEASLNRISISMEPLARFLGKTTLEAQPETTLEAQPASRKFGPSDKPKWNTCDLVCVCSAGHRAAQFHHRDCPVYSHDKVVAIYQDDKLVAGVDLADRLNGSA